MSRHSKAPMSRIIPSYPFLVVPMTVSGSATSNIPISAWRAHSSDSIGDGCASKSATKSSKQFVSVYVPRAATILAVRTAWGFSLSYGTLALGIFMPNCWRGRTLKAWLLPEVVACAMVSVDLGRAAPRVSEVESVVGRERRGRGRSWSSGGGRIWIF
jgi:hypothetical protein